MVTDKLAYLSGLFAFAVNFAKNQYQEIISTYFAVDNIACRVSYGHFHIYGPAQASNGEYE